MKRKALMVILVIAAVLIFSSCQPGQSSWGRFGWIDLPDWISGTYVGHPYTGNAVPFSYAVVGFYDDNNILITVIDINGTSTRISVNMASLLMDGEGIRDASQTHLEELKSYGLYIYNDDGTTDIISINGLTEPATLEWKREQNGLSITYFNMWLEKDPLEWEGGV